MQIQDQHNKFNLTLIGDTQVGKSSITSQYHWYKFDLHERPTIGVDFFTTSLYFDEFLMEMRAWDTGGQERVRNIVKSYFRSTNGFIIVYDITNRSSFLNLTNWIAELTDVPKLIVGNKADLEKKRQVSFEEAREFGEKVGIKVIEVSAKESMNLEDTFSTIARQVVMMHRDIKTGQPYIQPALAEDKPIEAEIRPKIRHEIFRIVMIGDPGVGKSSFLSQLCRDEFSATHVPTIGVDFATRVITHKEENIKLQVWDTAGESRFRNIIQSYYKGADAIILIYDITNRSSFTNLDSWLQEVREPSGGNRAIKIVAGNKNDLEKERKVSYDEGKDYAKTIDSYFFEFSAKKADFQSSFIKACNDVIENSGIEIKYIK